MSHSITAKTRAGEARINRSGQSLRPVYEALNATALDAGCSGNGESKRFTYSQVWRAKYALRESKDKEVVDFMADLLRISSKSGITIHFL